MPNHHDPGNTSLHFKVLKEAIRAVPSVKYALGVAGLVAAIGIIELLVRQKWIVAIVGTVVMLLMMTMLVLFARMASVQAHELRKPITFFVWFVLLLTCAFALTLFTTVTMARPQQLATLLGIKPGPQRDSVVQAHVPVHTVTIQPLGGTGFHLIQVRLFFLGIRE